MIPNLIPGIIFLGRFFLYLLLLPETRCIQLFQSCLPDHISHHHIRDRALQKNGRLIIKRGKESSICNRGYKEDNFKPVFFFLRKYFKCKKAPNAKQATFIPLEVCERKKMLPLLFFCLLIFVLLVDFLFASVFIRLKSFRKTKK